MTYEAAPATALVATLCACCARPLLDATSVETGVGPECRKKHGFADAQGEPDWTAAQHAIGLVAGETLLASAFDAWGLDARAVANKLVHRIAVDQDGANVAALTNGVRALGFTKLADRIAKRLAKVEIVEAGAELSVRAPYSEDATNAFRKVPGRRWDREAKVNRFPVASKRALFAALCDLYPGATATGPKGLFTLPA